MSHPPTARVHWGPGGPLRTTLLFLLTACGPPIGDEVCNGLDDDGDGLVDEDALDGALLWFDGDEDGYGDDLQQRRWGCPGDPRRAIVGGDCDDLDADVSPGDTERCNGRDDDCDGALDPREVDEDGDRVRICEGDCDDTDPSIHRGAVELCDGIDQDCDGSTDEADLDGDGVRGCDGDCDDADASVHPGRTETCDDVDRDCDGQAWDGPAVPGTHVDLQAALDGAEDDARICLGEGTFTGPVQVDRPVAILGRGADRTRLVAAEGPIVLLGREAARVGLHGLTLHSETWRNRGDWQALVQGVRDTYQLDVDLIDVEVPGPTCSGDGCAPRPFYVPWARSAVHDLDLERVRVHGFAAGGPTWLPIDQATDVVIEDITVGGPSCTGSERILVQAQQASDLRIADVQITDCEGEGGGAPGVLYAGTADGLVVEDIAVSAESLAWSDLIRAGILRDGIVRRVRTSTGSWGARLVLAEAIDGLVVEDVQTDHFTVVAANEARAVDLDGVTATGPLPLLEVRDILIDGRVRDTSAEGALLHLWSRPSIAGIDVVGGRFGAGVQVNPRVASLAAADVTLHGLTLDGPILDAPETRVRLRRWDVRDVAAPSGLQVDTLDAEAILVAGSALSGPLVDATESALAHWTVHGLRTPDGAVPDALFRGPLTLGHSTLSGPLPAEACFADAADLDQVNRADAWTDGCLPTSDAGARAVDPGFRDVAGPDPTAWDLRLDDASPLRDTGTCTESDGTLCDLGAYGGDEGELW